MLAEPMCSFRHCAHLAGAMNVLDDEPETAVPVCLAFPKGIPEEIAYGPDKHFNVRHDQVGDYVYTEEHK